MWVLRRLDERRWLAQLRPVVVRLYDVPPCEHCGKQRDRKAKTPDEFYHLTVSFGYVTQKALGIATRKPCVDSFIHLARVAHHTITEPYLSSAHTFLRGSVENFVREVESLGVVSRWNEHSVPPSP